ncbi:MAG: hypothetical protein ACI93R_002320 [Flavobacteriales bacterium]|jgi:hypothetical protein
MKLFWMNSFDHGEDWFVVARSPKLARCFYAREMGYDEIDDEITALEVCKVPGFTDKIKSFFADSDVITRCGGELVLYDNADLLDVINKEILQHFDPDSRIVKLGNRIFVEGNIVRSAYYYLNI